MKRGRGKTGMPWLLLSVSGFLGLSLAFIIMPLTRAYAVQGLRLLPGGLFWLGLAAGMIGQIFLELRRRRFFARYQADRRNYQKRRCGALSFFSNKAAAAADVAMPVCLIGLALSLALSQGTADICYVFMALTAFSVSMHCILNGRNYLFVYNQNRVRQVLEQKKNFKQGEEEK